MLYNQVWNIKNYRYIGDVSVPNLLNKFLSTIFDLLKLSISPTNLHFFEKKRWDQDLLLHHLSTMWWEDLYVDLGII